MLEGTRLQKFMSLDVFLVGCCDHASLVQLEKTYRTLDV